MRSLQQSEQNTSPHTRQWWRRFNSVNSFSHFLHSVVSVCRGKGGKKCVFVRRGIQNTNYNQRFFLLAFIFFYFFFCHFTCQVRLNLAKNFSRSISSCRINRAISFSSMSSLSFEMPPPPVPCVFKGRNNNEKMKTLKRDE